MSIDTNPIGTSTNPIAYSYVRFSTKSQATGTSLTRQLNASLLYCANNNLTLSTKGYHDLGVSGFKSVKRPQLDDMLAAINSGEIQKGSYILIEAIDRLSRKGISYTQDVLKQILAADINVAFVGEDAKTLMNTTLNKDSLNDLSSVILVALAADLAYKESLRKSKLVKAAKAITRAKAISGINQPGNVAFWLSFDESTEKYIFNERLSVIKKIIELRLQGYGPRRISRVLNQQEIPSPRNKQWNHVTITSVLRTPVLYGAYQTHIVIDGKHIPDTLVENYFPAVTDYDTCLQLKADLTNITKGNPSKANPFAGLLKCKCGAGMIFHLRKHSRTNQKEYQYHYCINATEGKCQYKKRIPDLIPVLAHIMDKLSIKTVYKQNNNLEIKAKEAKINQLTNMLIELENPPISIMKTIASLEEEKEKLLNSDTPSISQDDIKKLSEVDDAAEYNMLLKRVISKIVVHQHDDSGKNFRIEVFKLNKHKQNFQVTNGVIMFSSDTERLKNALAKMREE